MSIWYSRRKKEEKSLRLAAAGKSAFCFAELHYDARSLLRRVLRWNRHSAYIAKLTAKNEETTGKGRKEAPFGLF